MQKLWYATFLIVISVANASPKSEDPLKGLPEAFIFMDLPQGETLKVGDHLPLKVTLPTAVLNLGETFELDLSHFRFGSLVTFGFSYQPESFRFVDDKIVFEIIPIRSGPLKLYPIPIKASNGDLVAKTRILEVDVQSAFSKSEKQRPAMPYFPVLGADFPRWLMWTLSILSLILFVGLVFGAWIWYQRYKTKKAIEEGSIVLPEHEEALLHLKELKKESLWEKGKSKDSLFKSTLILKRYLGRRYQFDCVGATATEVEHHLKTKGLNENIQAEISLIFENMEEFKYSDKDPKKEDCIELIDGIEKFVKKTKKKFKEASIIEQSKISSPKGEV